MYSRSTLKNGLTLITVNLPHLDSVTTLLAVGVGSRYESKRVAGISHFLEHMFFKGSKKYPTAEIIANLVDGIGAINNAGTDKEVTFYWIKSAAKHLGLASDILSSQLKESLFAESEVEREKGVIIEEMRMYQDNPNRYVWSLYDQLQFGDTPLGRDIIGTQKSVTSFNRNDFLNYIQSFYAPSNMALVYAGKLPKDIEGIAEKYFGDLPKNSLENFEPFKSKKQTKPKVSVYYKKTDQVHLVLGVEGYDRDSDKKYAARVLGIILGEGMSSRLFMQIRERRGLAYSVFAFHEPLKDTGFFATYGGLKKEKIEEGLKVIIDELERTVTEKVTPEELKKAKEMERGRIALRSESTNFLAEHFGIKYVLDKSVESFEEYLKKIDQVSAEDIQAVASELFQRSKFNLQIIGPFKEARKFEAIITASPKP
ncbi:MAG: pitrilysin family protein [Candidatus Daviesbacteria bacterium]|nr:pitrilysin family protein [Candidatus Daviesbacteria bacterium]